MANMDYVNKVLADNGYDPNARVANARATGSEQRLNIKAAPKQDFLSNVGKSLGAIPGAVVGSVANTLSNSSFAKIPQIIGAYGSLDRQKQSLNRRDAMFAQANKDFHAGKIDAKGYAKRLQDAISATDITQERKKTEGALKDASRYGEQFVNNAMILGTVAGGIAGATGKTGIGAVGQAAVDQAYSGGAKAFGKGVLGEVGALSRPFGGEAAGGLVKSLTGAAGGALDAQAMASTVNEARKGKFDPLNTALTATSLAPGGVVKLGSEAIGKASSAVSKRIYDTYGLYDVVKLKGGMTVNQATDALMAKNPQATKQFQKTLKVFQDLATQEHGLGPDSVAKAIEAYQPTGKKFADMTYDDFLRAASSIINDRSTLQRAAKKAGLKIPDGASIVAARLTPESKAIISKRLAEADDPMKALQQLKKEGILKGPNLPGQVEDMVKSGARGELLAKQINSLKSVQPALIDGKMVTTKDGRFLAFAKGAGTVRKASEVPEIVKGSKAQFGAIGRTLEKIGLSTKQANPAEQKAIFSKVKDNFVKSINANNDIKLNGNEIMNRLNKYTETKPGIFDLRQLSKGEVAGVLGVDKAQAGTILGAYNDAFKSLSYAERGLGGKITDFNMRNNPLAPKYSKIQSIARYEKNPFFRVQENIETRAGVASLTGKGAMPFSDKNNDVIKTLRDNGVFKDYFAGPAGEGAAGLGAISAKLSKDQENVLAAALTSMAGDKSKVLSFVADPKNASLMQDLKAVVQYPDKGFTSSNLMKALNLAVFPLRYNMKVTSLAAKALGQQNGVRQVAILKNLSDFNRWQKTPAGIKWNSDNSEALGVLRYLTPIGSIEATLNLLGGNAQNLRDVGTIGGLPFGVVSQVLQGQGVINTDSPYLDPKTGEVVPNRIPKDLKARAEQALSDIINTMFTYPGRQIGAPKSKKDVSKDLASVVSLGQLKGGKYETVTRTDLTPQQRKQQAVLQAGQKKVNLNAIPSPKVKTVNLSSSKPVTITPIYKNSKPKKAKTRAIPVGRFQP